MINCLSATGAAHPFCFSWKQLSEEHSVRLLLKPIVCLLAATVTLSHWQRNCCSLSYDCCATRRKHLKLPSVSAASTPDFSSSAQASFLSDLCVQPRVCSCASPVYVILAKHAVSNRRWNKHLGVSFAWTAEGEKSFWESLGFEMLILLILAECSGRVFLQTGWGGVGVGGWLQGGPLFWACSQSSQRPNM